MDRLNDNPIQKTNEDRLGRTPLARDFAYELLGLDRTQGAAVSVMGPWGSGKTSFVNLMRQELTSAESSEEGLTPGKSPVVIEFNPWLFSGDRQLIDVFFTEVAGALKSAGSSILDKSRLDTVVTALDKYGDALSPIELLPMVGGVFGASKQAVRAIRKLRGDAAQPLQQKVADALRDFEQPVVIIIDDIDRLTTPEIREIFKLVRLTASFPNVIYLLVFDRDRVEAALGEDQIPGRAYLEKIVQLGFDLPAIPHATIRSELFDALNPILDGLSNLRFDQDRWPTVFMEVVEPLVGSLRDVARFVLSARSTIRTLGAEVEVVDLLALESVRVFRPHIFAALRSIRAILTTSSAVNRITQTYEQLDFEGQFQASAQDHDLVRSLVTLVFPAAAGLVAGDVKAPTPDIQRLVSRSAVSGNPAEWCRDHRVANCDFLDMYFDRVEPEGLSALHRTEMAYSRMSDGGAFDTYLRDLPPEDLEDVIHGLEVWEDKYQISSVVPATVVLMNLISYIPERAPRNFFDFSRPDLVVTRVVLRLLRRLDDPTQCECTVGEIILALRSFSSQREIIDLVSPKADGRPGSVGQMYADKLKADFVQRLSTENSPVPTEEWNALKLFADMEAPRDSPFYRQMLATPESVRALFRSGRTTSKSQTLGARDLRVEERLAWDLFVQVLGSEDAVKSARDTLADEEGESDLVRLIDKYLDGWRPDSEHGAW